MHRERYLAFEFLLLFFGLPVALIYTEDIFPLIPTILVVTGAVVVWLRVSGWQYRELWHLGPARAWRNMLATFLLFAAFWTVVVLLFLPESFLSFPRERFDIWILVMLLYPILSAFPQEVLYRTFLFRRYRELFGGNALALIAASGVAFMWGHIFLMSWFTLFVTFIGGLVFAWRYYHTRSLFLVAVEHALYGNLFFTLGLGQFLFSGAV